MAVRPIDGDELLGIERLLDTDVVRQSKTASWLLDQVLHDIQAMPTLTPPNEPLSIEQLREMDGEPVWIVEHPDWGHWELSADAEDYIADRDQDLYGLKHDGKHKCSECGGMALEKHMREVLSNYCPNCGAKMDGGDGR